MIVEISSFGFPFEPYPIQVDFMRTLYSTIQLRKHGIFESPTGTVLTSLFCENRNEFVFSLSKGKSLSLICGSLRWIFDEIQSWKDEYEELLKPVETKNESRYIDELWLCFYPSFECSSDDWLKRLMKRKEEETIREKRRVCPLIVLYQSVLFFQLGRIKSQNRS